MNLVILVSHKILQKTYLFPAMEQWSKLTKLPGSGSPCREELKESGVLQAAASLGHPASKKTKQRPPTPRHLALSDYLSVNLLA